MDIGQFCFVLLGNLCTDYLIWHASHFYGLLLDLFEKHIAAHFAKYAAIWKTHCIFTGIAPQSLYSSALQDVALSGIA